MAGWGACVAGGHTWQGGKGVHGSGACMAGDMYGRGHAWQGTCMAGGMHATHAPLQHYEIWSVNA